MKSEKPCFCLRLDIDTIRDAKATQELLHKLDGLDIKATLFVTMGMDDSGRNLPNALARVAKGKYLRRYGMDGLKRLLVPASIEASLLKWVLTRGHELGLHGYWHRNWVRKAHRWKANESEENIKRGMESFRMAFGLRPSGFAAPGFVSNPNLLFALDDYDFVYTSNTRLRDGGPYMPTVQNRQLSYIEMPVSCYNLEELILRGFSKEEALGVIKRDIEEGLTRRGYFCYYTHPSFEVFVEKDYLVQLLLQMIENDVRMPVMKEVAEEWRRHATPQDIADI